MRSDELPSVAWFLGIRPIKNVPPTNTVAAEPYPTKEVKDKDFGPPPEVVLVKQRKRPEKYNWSKYKDSSEEEDEVQEWTEGNFCYLKMITQAINNHPDQQATLQEIYDYLYEKYEFLRHKRRSWKRNVRQSLAMEKQFMRVRRTKTKPTTWKIDTNINSAGSAKRKKRCHSTQVTETVAQYLEAQHKKKRLIAPSEISLFDQDDRLEDATATTRTPSSQGGSTENGTSGYREYECFTPVLQQDEHSLDIGLEEIESGQVNQYFPEEELNLLEQQDLWGTYEYCQPRYEYGPSTSSLEFYNTNNEDNHCIPLPSSNTLLEKLRPESSLNEQFSEAYAGISW